MTQEVPELPPLPEPELYVNALGEVGSYNPADYGYGIGADGYYTADQMRAYATQALTQAVARIAELEKRDMEAANEVEAVICLRTGFTGDPPYVGWAGLGLALREALNERDELRAASTQAVADAQRLDWIEQMILQRAGVWLMPCGQELRFVQLRWSGCGEIENFPTVKGLRAALDEAMRQGSQHE